MSYDNPPPPPPPYGQPSYSGVPAGDGGALRGATLPQAVERFFTKYAGFQGRASRSEFWYWTLASAIVAIVLGILVQISGVFRIIEALWDLAIIVPSIALQCRRLHDIGKSGWWQLIGLIPCVGWIIMIVWDATPPKPEGNRYNAVA